MSDITKAEVVFVSTSKNADYVSAVEHEDSVSFVRSDLTDATMAAALERAAKVARLWSRAPYGEEQPDPRYLDSEENILALIETPALAVLNRVKAEARRESMLEAFEIVRPTKPYQEGEPEWWSHMNDVLETRAYQILEAAQAIPAEKKTTLYDQKMVDELFDLILKTNKGFDGVLGSVREMARRVEVLRGPSSKSKRSISDASER